MIRYIKDNSMSALGVRALWISIGITLLLFLSFSAGCNPHKCDQRIGGNCSKSPSVCPIPALKESEYDCPWAGIARQMLAPANANKAIKQILNEHSPDIVRSLKSDALQAEAIAVWGESFNFDEKKRAVIVNPRILAGLFTLVKIPAPRLYHLNRVKVLIAHAGIIHTYGYLFSNLLTDYGYKRSRWVEGEIEFGFALPSGILGPRPAEGTLFQNVSFFLSRIAFRKNTNMIDKIRDWNAPAALMHFNYHSLKIRRLSEEVQLNVNRTVSIHSDLVRFMKAKNGKPRKYLLIYSYEDSANSNPKLLTAFPVSASFGDSMFDSACIGKNRLIHVRFNGYIPGLSDFPSPLKGHVQEIK